MLRQIRLSLKSPTKYFTFFPEEDLTSVKIGRSLRCEFSVPLEDLSREHCILEILNGEYYLTDLKSKNGVYVDQVRIAPDQKTKVTPTSLIVLANIYTLSINPTEILSKSESAITKKVDREIETMSFQLEYPPEKNKALSKQKKETKKAINGPEENNTTPNREMIVMALGFIGITIYLLYEFVLSN